MAKPIPDGFRSVTPHLAIRGAGDAIEFYKKAFGAEEVMRMPGPGGMLMHAEIRIGDSFVMLADEWPDAKGTPQSPQSLNGTSASLMLYVKDCDASYKKAVDAGATALCPPTDMFWGDRYGKVADPFGHQWAIATHMKDLTPAQIEKGAAEFMQQMAAQQS